MKCFIFVKLPRKHGIQKKRMHNLQTKIWEWLKGTTVATFSTLNRATVAPFSKLKGATLNICFDHFPGSIVYMPIC
jgi:hypothetical protein